MEKFDWPRIHKHEENLENDATERVENYICEYFGIEDIVDMTREQKDEVEDYKDNMNEFSQMAIGFINVVNRWDDEHYEEE